MSMQIVFEQILIIFGYVIVGYVAGKKNLITKEQQRYLSKLVSSLILPFTVLSASSMEASGQDIVNVAIAVALLFSCMALTSAGCMLYAKIKQVPEKKRAAYTGLCTYPNCTFIGMPLCIALMGEWGTLYGAAGIIAFNLLFFTLQISLFTRKKFHPKIFLTPLNISTLALILMLIFHLHFPRPLQTVCSNIGGITTPMALIIVGVMLADGNLLQIVTEKRAYVISLIRNLICPLIMLVVMALLPLNPNLRMAVLIYVACPVANLTSVYAIQHDMEPALCARATLLSTILFAATIHLSSGLDSLYMAFKHNVNFLTKKPKNWQKDVPNW